MRCSADPGSLTKAAAEYSAVPGASDHASGHDHRHVPAEAVVCATVSSWMALVNWDLLGEGDELVPSDAPPRPGGGISAESNCWSLCPGAVIRPEIVRGRGDFRPSRFRWWGSRSCRLSCWPSPAKYLTGHSGEDGRPLDTAPACSWAAVSRHSVDGVNKGNDR